MSHSVRSSDRGEGVYSRRDGEKESGNKCSYCPVLEEESFTGKGSGMFRNVPCLSAKCRKVQRVSARVQGPTTPPPTLSHKRNRRDTWTGRTGTKRPDRVIRTLQTTSTSGQAKWMEERGGEGVVRDVSLPLALPHLHAGRLGERRYRRFGVAAPRNGATCELPHLEFGYRMCKTASKRSAYLLFSDA
jgi:hypothetical protein